jgi:hypothetical protein
MEMRDTSLWVEVCCIAMEYVRSNKLSYMTGLSVSAINGMRYSGKWIKGIHWFKASARVIYYYIPAIERSIKEQSL